MSFPRWIPSSLARRVFGLFRAYEDQDELTQVMDVDRTRVWAGQAAQASQAVKQLPGLIHFQPGLISLHRGQVTTTAYLYALAAAAETNLDLQNPDQRALYRELHTAARQSDALDRLLVVVAATTITSPDVPALQAS